MRCAFGIRESQHPAASKMVGQNPSYTASPHAGLSFLQLGAIATQPKRREAQKPFQPQNP